MRYLEKVGQYLKGDVINQPLNRNNNPWFKFLQDNQVNRKSFFVTIKFNQASANNSTCDCYSSKTCRLDNNSCKNPCQINGRYSPRDRVEYFYNLPNNAHAAHSPSLRLPSRSNPRPHFPKRMENEVTSVPSR